MGELLKAMTGSFSRAASAWIIPTSMLVAVVISTLMTADVLDARDRVTSFEFADIAGASILFAFIVLALAVTFAAFSDVFLRLLEGYALPTWVRRRLTHRHLGRREKLLHHDDWLGLRIYPEDETDVVATKLGNVIRRAERSRSLSQLDLVYWQIHLRALSTEGVRREVDEAYGGFQFFVALLANLTLVAAISATMVILGWVSYAVIAVLAFASLPIMYKQTVNHAGSWADTLIMMADLTHESLAEAFGLQVPASSQERRRMWEALGSIAYLSGTSAVSDLDKYRVAERSHAPD